MRLTFVLGSVIVGGIVIVPEGAMQWRRQQRQRDSSGHQATHKAERAATPVLNCRPPDHAKTLAVPMPAASGEFARRNRPTDPVPSHYLLQSLADAATRASA